MEEMALDEKFKTLARMGYAARGIIYLVIGGLALSLVFGGGGETTDSKGALLTVMQQPFGKVMLGVIIVGLVGYSCWRVIQSVQDVDHHGHTLKGLAVRGGLLASAATHGLLALWAIGVLVGSGGSPGDQLAQQGWINSGPGQLVLGVVALTVICAGIAHIYKGWTARFERYMSIPPGPNNWARPLCRFGLVARGVVWGIVGWFLLKSAMMARAGDIHGLEGALRSLRDNAYGPWLLGVVAAGLFAFGVYSLLEAFYRRIEASI